MDKINKLRVEIHQVNSYHECFSIIDSLSYRCKNLYNYANYLIRQNFFNNGCRVRGNELCAQLKSHELYKELPSSMAGQLIRQLDNDWSFFRRSLSDWIKYPSKYTGKPRIPHYKRKNGRCVAIIINHHLKMRNGTITFPKRYGSFQLITKIPLNNIKQVRIVPCGKCYKLEVVYNIEVPEKKANNGRMAAIDLGLNNFATITNNIGLQPVVINGKQIKSINQYYNKVISEIRPMLKKVHKQDWSNELERFNRKRNNKVYDFIHKASRYVTNYCLNNDINTLIIGNNADWKRGVNIGKVNNQKFVGIPYDSFIKKLEYKFENVGINVITTEESYTSKASVLDEDEIPKEYKENADYKFSGKRIKRGLYRSKNGTLINADCNGSYNIMRKVFPKALKADGIVGVGLHPVRMNILTKNQIILDL